MYMSAKFHLEDLKEILAVYLAEKLGKAIKPISIGGLDIDGEDLSDFDAVDIEFSLIDDDPQQKSSP